MMIRRAFVTLQIYFDQSGYLIATKRSIARATTILKNDLSNKIIRINNIYHELIV